ncbi:MAG: peptidase domain-containing ABC transporter [Lysobacteraceae bacterium]
MPKLKSLLQTEAAQCGHTCLAMVLDYHGRQMDGLTLQREYPTSMRGVTLANLIDDASVSGLQCRALRIELEELPQLETPCILHWDMDHFVVLAKATATEIVIHDPATGVRRLRMSEASMHFTGVALELSPTATFRKRKLDDSISLRHLVGQVTGLKRSAAQILSLSLILQLFGLLTPFYMQWVLDDVLVTQDKDLLWLISVGFLFSMLITSAIGWLRSWCLAYLSTRIGLQWFGSILAHLLRLPMDYFQKRHLGDVVSRMESVHAIQNTLSSSFIEALLDGLMVVIAVAVMVSYSWKLLLISVIAVGLYLAIRWATFPTIKRLSEQQLSAAAKQNTHLLESIRGIQALKLNAAESMRRATFGTLMADTANLGLDIQRFMLRFGFANQMLFGIERLLVVGLAAMLVMQGQMSAGMLVAYLAYKEMFTGGVSRLIDTWISFRTLRVQAERLADVVLTEPEEMTAPSGPALPQDRPLGLEVRGLRYRFSDSDPLVIDDCAFTVAPGETIALVGPSGCGKTTLMKLMLGLLKPQAGCILVEGRDIADIGLRRYRHAVAAVMQDDQLFAGSIADNIAFGSEDLDIARIEAAAQSASVHDDVMRMPMGYQTLIGDMGAALSGGQKQRVILARALYKQPSILFLDEATSHLDVDSERAVNEAVRKLKLTKILIAHRPETIVSAERVLVMANGRVEREYRPAERALRLVADADDTQSGSTALRSELLA